MDAEDLVRRRLPAEPERGGRNRDVVFGYGPDASAALTAQAVDVGYVVLVRVSGEPDMGSAPQLAAALRPFQARPCELDLARVSFMDSTGLAALLAPRAPHPNRGWKPARAGPLPAVVPGARCATRPAAGATRCAAASGGCSTGPPGRDIT